jgi:hypothetical protein
MQNYSVKHKSTGREGFAASGVEIVSDKAHVVVAWLDTDEFELVAIDDIQLMRLKAEDMYDDGGTASLLSLVPKGEDETTH